MIKNMTYKTAICCGSASMVGKVLRISVKTFDSGCDSIVGFNSEDTLGYDGPTSLCSETPWAASFRFDRKKLKRRLSRVHVGSILRHGAAHGAIA